VLDDVSVFSAGVQQSDDRAMLIVGFERYVRDCPGRGMDAADQINSAERMTDAGSVREAAAALEELRRRRPDDPRVMNALASVRLKLGDAAGAERILSTAVRLAPDVALYAENLAQVLGAHDFSPERAKEAMQKVLALALFASCQLVLHNIGYVRTLSTILHGLAKLKRGANVSEETKMAAAIMDAIWTPWTR
jgi:tetratricopeptide (TPR) repeat protein